MIPVLYWVPKGHYYRNDSQHNHNLIYVGPIATRLHRLYHPTIQLDRFETISDPHGSMRTTFEIPITYEISRYCSNEERTLSRGSGFIDVCCNGNTTGHRVCRVDGGPIFGQSWAHWEAVKRIFRYLRGTQKLELVYGGEKRGLEVCECGWTRA